MDVQLDDTMLSQMLLVVSWAKSYSYIAIFSYIDTILTLQTSSTIALYQPLGPLPDCSYITTNQPVPCPVPPTTASKAIKEALNKRKAAGTKPKDATGKKRKTTCNKTKIVGNTAKKK